MTRSRRHFGQRATLSQWLATRPAIGTRVVGTSHPTTFHQKADANAFLDAVSASIGRGDWVDPELGRISFARYAELWLAQRTDIRARTKEYYGWLITNRLVPTFGQRELAKITPVHVRAWYADLAGQTPGVARSAYRLLKAIFNTAITDDLILKNPCRVKGGGTDRVTERRIPDVNQVAALTQAMPEQYRAAVIVAAWGTLRRGEVLGLERRDVDLVAGTVRVERTLHEFHDGSLDLGPTKNGDPRKVYLPSSRPAGAGGPPAALRRPRERRSPLHRCHGRAAAPEQLLGHLGDRTPAGRTHVGALPRPAPLRRHHVRHHRCEHEGDHEPRRVEVRRHGGALRARLRRARRAARPSAQPVRRGANVVPIDVATATRSRT